MFKQVEIPGKGQGLFATAQLPVGTIVIQESPFFTAPDLIGDHDAVCYAVEEIVSKFRRLTDEQKNQVLSLHDPDHTPGWLCVPHPSPDPGPTFLLPFAFADETEKKAVRIFSENCIGLCHREGTIDRSAMYKTISRINHSCAPNVVWSWILGDKSKVEKQMRVVREIKEGEEILVRYWGAFTFPSRDERQARLRDWNFICNCEVCSLTGDELIENEKVRKKIRDLHAAIDVKLQLGLPKQAYEAAKEKLKMMRSIEKEMVVQLLDALLKCCEMAALCNLPSSHTSGMMKQAKDMSGLFGDSDIDYYMKEERRIALIRRKVPLG